MRRSANSVWLVCPCLTIFLWTSCARTNEKGPIAGPHQTIFPNGEVISFSTFADHFSPLDTIWVDAKYNPASHGVTPANHTELFYDSAYVGNGSALYPFVMLQQAVADQPLAAKAGTLIAMRAGTYSNRGPLFGWNEARRDWTMLISPPRNGITVYHGGTTTNPMAIVAVDGKGSAIIDGLFGNDGSGLGLYIAWLSYIIIDGLEVRNCMQNIQLLGNDTAGHDIMIRNCHVHHSGFNGDCIKASQMSNVYVENCELHDPGWRDSAHTHMQESLDFVAINGGHVVQCEVYNGDFGLYAKGGSRNITFYGNYVHNHKGSGLTLGGWTDAGYFFNAKNLPTDDKFEAYNCKAYNNVIANTGGPGLECIGGIDCDAQFNTLINCALDSATFDSPVEARPGNSAQYWYAQSISLRNDSLFPSAPKNFTFKNNVIANYTTRYRSFFRNHDQGTGVRAPVSELHVSYNAWYNAGKTIADGDATSHFAVSGDTATSLVMKDPLINAVTLPNVQIESGSPVKDRGYNSGVVRLDFMGKVRDEHPDMGAFEL